MKIEVSTHVAAPTSVVWMAVSDVSSWPSWTDSMERVQLDSMCRIGVESKARVKQPGMPEMTWTVTRWDTGRGFAWESRMPGLTTIGTHDIEPDGTGSRLLLSLEQTGWLAPLVELVSGKRSRRYVRLELDGLTRAAEAMPQAG